MNLQFITKNEEIKEKTVSFIREWESESPYFESRTSGSTGTPKLIRIEKNHAFASARGTIDFLQLESSDNALLCLSTDTIGGKMMIVRSIVNSMNLYIMAPVSNPLSETNIAFDFIAIAPIQLVAILQKCPEKLRKIRTVIVGGGIIPEVIQQLLKQAKITVYQTFGMTETISHIALRKVGFEQEAHYTTLGGITVSDKNGQLCIHAPEIGISELVTNDTVELLNERQFKWIGRADFVINSGGIKIQIEQLEAELQKEISEKFFVHSKQDDALGEKVIILVEGNQLEPMLQKRFYSFLNNKYHIPKEIAFVEQFILTPSDKINRIANFESVKKSDFIPIC